MSPEKTVFDRTYENYVAQLSKIDFKSVASNLGLNQVENRINIPLFGKTYEVSVYGITDPSGIKPPYDICVVLCKYLLLFPYVDPKESEWVSFKDFKDAGPLTTYFANDVERGIASYFSEKLDELKNASKALSGYRPDLDVHYDLAAQFDALPRVPVMMLYNDADEEFHAKCSILFERRAERYLDAECLAIVGWQLFSHLKNAHKNTTMSDR